MKEIHTSLLAADLDRFITEESSKERLVQTVLVDARRAAHKGDKDAHRGLLAFAKEQTSGFRHPSELGPVWSSDHECGAMLRSQSIAPHRCSPAS